MLQKMITICGSTRFIEHMAVCAWILERDESVIVMGLHLLPKWYTDEKDHVAESEGVAEAIDALHRKKIELCDEVFVVDVDHYIGEATLKEVHYARVLNKLIRWYTEDDVGHMVNALLKERIK